MRLSPVGLLLVAATVSIATVGAAPRRPPLQWRVEGSEAALTPTARVRIDIVNDLPPSAAQPRLGLVQVVALLHASGAGVADRLETAARESGFTPAPPSGPTPGPARVSVEPGGIALDDLPAAIVLGRAVAVMGDVDPAAPPLLAVRADPADLEERRQWSPETLVPPGESRRLWEGSVPVSVDRLYADYLVVRTPAGPAVGVSPDPDVPSASDATYEAGAVQSMARGRAPETVSLGTTLAQAAPPRLFPIRFQVGQTLNLRLRAWQDGAGSFRIDLQIVAPPAGPD